MGWLENKVIVDTQRFTDKRKLLSMSRKSYIIILPLALLSITLQPFSYAQMDPVYEEHQIKAAYVYHLLRYAQWPENAEAQPDETINICTVGKGPIGRMLRVLESDHSGEHKINVVLVRKLAKLASCQVVLISRTEEYRLKNIVRFTNKLPILTISDLPNFVNRGGIIELRKKENNIKIVINPQNAERNEIKFSSLLLEVAILVNNNRPER